MLPQWRRLQEGCLEADVRSSSAATSRHLLPCHWLLQGQSLLKCCRPDYVQRCHRAFLPACVQEVWDACIQQSALSDETAPPHDYVSLDFRGHGNR
eukprot:scaffold7538_cov248-Pinguiococcus_pyrenoidosus.AAC.4